jgi:hypothetical protein
MAHSGRQRHRDREPGLRHFEDTAAGPGNRVFRMTEAERQTLARYLRSIDDARRTLESHHSPDNRLVIRDLRAAADRIFELISDLAEDTEIDPFRV